MGQRIVEEDSILVELRGNEVQGDFRGQGEEREAILSVHRKQTVTESEW